MELEDLLERIKDRELALDISVEGKGVLGIKLKGHNIDIDIKDLKAFKDVMGALTK